MTVQALGSVSVVFDAAGAGRGDVGPGAYGVRWNVSRLVTSATGTLVPALHVYMGTETPGALIDTTSQANSDVSETDFDMRSGDRVIAVYSGGSVGSVGTFIVYGELSRDGDSHGVS